MIKIDLATLGDAPRDLLEKSRFKVERTFTAYECAFVEYYYVDGTGKYIETIGYDKITLQ